MGSVISFVQWHRRPLIAPLLEYDEIDFRDMLPDPALLPVRGVLERDAVQGYAAGQMHVAEVVAGPALDGDEIFL